MRGARYLVPAYPVLTRVDRRVCPGDGGCLPGRSCFRCSPKIAQCWRAGSARSVVPERDAAHRDAAGCSRHKHRSKPAAHQTRIASVFRSSAFATEPGRAISGGKGTRSTEREPRPGAIRAIEEHSPCSPYRSRCRPARRECITREFAAQQNYWTRDQQGHEWQGRLAGQWDLTGPVRDEHFWLARRGAIIRRPENNSSGTRFQGPTKARMVKMSPALSTAPDGTQRSQLRSQFR